MNAIEFIRLIDNKTYQRIRKSKGNAECRRYLLNLLQKLQSHENNN